MPGGPAPVKLAVAGLGKMGILHAALIAQLPDAELVALCDRQRKLKNFLRSFGFRCPFYPSLDALLQQQALDGLIVSTPQFAHRELAEQALARGVGVFCEKPLAHTLAEANRMLQLAREHADCPTATGFMVGHYPIYREVKRLLDDGLTGRVTSYTADLRLSQVSRPKKGWIYTRARSGGGVLANSGPHLLYLVQHWFGPVRQVCARCESVHSHEVEDRATLQLQHTNRVTGTLTADWTVPGYPTQEHAFRIETTDTTLLVNDRELRDTGDELRLHEADFSQPPFNLTPHYGGAGFTFQLQDFIAALQDNRSAQIDWQAGAAVNALLAACYQSSEQDGAAVTVEAPG